ncbi:hypothetical protein Sango_3064900 [Sesamum angolense]|uniref:Reverse transcriptase domain-containing protein n=1 Tax=Sesamum angolense TaxID=2727404 RepID=A0AAE1W170_9LAMI|nr:hypothetical protein Sango_3064900 [Sesamum angolense]
MAEFRTCMLDTGLVQLPFTGCPYTWHNCSEGTRSLWKRLDRMLVNEAWLEKWPGSSYISALPSTSDHSPLIISGTNGEAERTIFRFDNYLAQLPGFLGSVENIWKHHITGTEMYEVVCKLKALKAVFRRQRKQKGNLTENVKLAKGYLDKAQELFAVYRDDVLLHLVKCCRMVYSEAIKLELSMLKQRAKLRWMKHGDQNSRVFFRKINSKRAKHMIFQITNAAELKHTLTLEEANLLIRPVTREEIKEAIFDIDEKSAPGPDGYTSAFFKSAWPVVGQAISEAICEFFRTGQLLKQVNVSTDTERRSIADNILLAQELLAGYNQRRLPPRCTLKVDIQKAYDSVEWDFLLESSKRCPFPISLEMQGTWSECQSRKKSDYTISSCTTGRQQIIECLGFQEGFLPIRYLGVPLTSSRLTIADCRPLLTKVDTRLAGWSHHNLSYAGRVQLIRSVLNTLHIYWASVFILPKGIISILEGKMRKFLWQGPNRRGNAKVAWDQICKPKEEGGLGIRSMTVSNKALMMKHLWRILQNDGTSIWVNGFSSTGFKNPHFGRSMVRRALGVGRRCLN